MKALKIAAFALAALAALVGAAIAIVASQFDAARIKSELAKVVKEQKQRTLNIDGELQLSFWPNVGVRLGKLSLSERQSDQVFATVESARVAIAVMPLLSQRIVVASVEIDGAKLALIKHADGTLNIDDLFAQDKSASAPLQLDIAAVKIANAQLSWHDEKTGRRASIGGLDLATGRILADTGRKVVQIDTLALAAKGRLGADDFAFKLAAPKLTLTPEKSGGDSITLDIALADAQRNASLKLALAGVEGTAQALKIAKLALALDAKAGATRVKGTLDSALAADFGQQRVALEKFSGSFDIAHTQLPLKTLKLPVHGTLRADLARQAASGNLATQFDESKLALKFDIAKFAPLALAFDLDIDRLNVDKYLPPKKAGAAAKKSGDGKLDFSALKHLDLNGTVKIGSLQFAKVKATHLKLQVKTVNGRLDIAPHAANSQEHLPAKQTVVLP